MSDDTGKTPDRDPDGDPAGGGRRKEDRRKAQLPFEGPDRRKGDRRAGTDRRNNPRGGDLD